MTYRSIKRKNTNKGWDAKVLVETPLGDLEFTVTMRSEGRIRVRGERGVWLTQWRATVKDDRGALLFNGALNGEMEPIGVLRLAGIEEFIQARVAELGKADNGGSEPEE